MLTGLVQNLCLNKSKEHNIRSARLPIGTYLAEMQTRKVLTVNQTFEILLRWIETRDWEQALYAVMPKRKFNTAGRRRRGCGAAESSNAGDSADEGAEGNVSGGEDGVQVLGLATLEVDAEQASDLSAGEKMQT